MSKTDDLKQIVRERLEGWLDGTRILTVDVAEQNRAKEDAYLRLRVTYDRDAEPPDAERAAAFVRVLRPHLLAAEEARFPVLSFVAASESRGTER